MKVWDGNGFSDLSVAYGGSYRPLLTLIIFFVLFILANKLHTLSNRKLEFTIIIIVMLLVYIKKIVFVDLC